ncbi:hypothetical protein [Pseudorhodoplanes sinuspersici]|uniref:Uncharacterized protein n=1 Tax=Pseudorhodoplanes sinuspersici TaxID=1235591 RepID=A0A1W6ZKJ6_9HYPH|nr:hypothetical protein [Pseudorhodoplanes sinuspersici]ARP97869.1 hypothetical protein CAK95_01310 [Pseudorhodoplanes sinuspersici]RKE68396.1 hypothetical protein DFP91_4782 [Pseudorhodoplanes sinuspersici]
MSITKTALVAASLVVAATVVNAADRGGLDTGFHGNTSAATYIGGPKSAFAPSARSSFAQTTTVRSRAVRTEGRIQMVRMNPLLDMFHGLMVR